MSVVLGEHEFASRKLEAEITGLVQEREHLVKDAQGKVRDCFGGVAGWGVGGVGVRGKGVESGSVVIYNFSWTPFL